MHHQKVVGHFTARLRIMGQNLNIKKMKRMDVTFTVRSITIRSITKSTEFSFNANFKPVFVKKINTNGSCHWFLKKKKKAILVITLYVDFF